MKFFIAFIALIAVVNGSLDHWGRAPALVHHVAPVVHHAIVKTPIYQQSYIPQTVHLGTSHHSYPVTEHRFTRT